MRLPAVMSRLLRELYPRGSMSRTYHDEGALRHALVVRPPGGRLRRLAQLCFSKATNEEIFDPILDEMLAEHCAALAARDLTRGRFAVVRGYARFWAAVVGRLPVSFIKLFF
jgi:hypothetical protein